MCTFFDSEVVLLNALRNDHDNAGVGYRDIRDYCTRVKNSLFNEEKARVSGTIKWMPGTMKL